MHFSELKFQPDPQYLSRLQRALRRSRAGEHAAAYLTDNNVPVVFKRTKSAGINGEYDPTNPQIRMDKNERIAPASLILIHEARHSRQHCDFPELFPELSNAIHFYVRRKLIEFDANVSVVEHIAPALRAYKTAKEAFNDYNKPENEFVRSNMVRLNSKPHEEKRGKDENEDLIELAFAQMTPSRWAFYDRNIFSHAPQLFQAIYHDEFKDMVTSFKFLAPEFLENFCRTWDGQSYLPKDRAPFFDRLKQNISTVHDPHILQTAEELGQLDRVQSRERIIQMMEASRHTTLFPNPSG